MRKHHYHVVTPFCRWQNAARFIVPLHVESVTWHPLIEDDVGFGFGADWIQTHFFPRTPSGWHPASWSVNHFLDNGPIVDSHRYMVLPDDDKYEDGFFDKIDQVEGDVLVVSMQRGGDRLVADQGNFHLAGVGGEQMVCLGRIWRTSRYSNVYEGDWTFMEKIGKENKIAFVPDATVHFNVI